MPKPYNESCSKCGKPRIELNDMYVFSNDPVCEACFHTLQLMEGDTDGPELPKDNVYLPAHYHRYNMDTITFLREGFPPDVLRGFLIGNVIKYTQRFQLKNGLEDLDKALNYMTILRDEERKNHS